MSAGNTNKYGIPLVRRTTQVRPKTLGALAGNERPEVLDSAKKVIKEHREVIKALAKR